MREKKTRGKQKINIKKIEKDEERMVTFSKRRSGIYTKISEISILCGVEVGFLIYSGAGKPFTFGSPTFGAVAERFLNRDHQPENNNEGSSLPQTIVDAHRKVKLDELCKSYNSLMEEMSVEEEREVSVVPVERDAWWKVDPKEIEEEEEAMQLMEKYEKFYERLCEVVAGGTNYASPSQVNHTC